MLYETFALESFNYWKDAYEYYVKCYNNQECEFGMPVMGVKLESSPDETEGPDDKATANKSKALPPAESDSSDVEIISETNMDDFKKALGTSVNPIEVDIISASPKRSRKRKHNGAQTTVIRGSAGPSEAPSSLTASSSATPLEAFMAGAFPTAGNPNEAICIPLEVVNTIFFTGYEETPEEGV